LKQAQDIHPFNLLAYVILPDHFHWLMRIENESGNFSKVMHSIKRNFSLNYKEMNRFSMPLKLWQSRFWDHVIRDEQDLNRHFDYIHWNPIKHGYVDRPERWLVSSYQFWLNRGYYSCDWGWENEPEGIKEMNYE
jgi:putative transposase